ncbi:hypothetical protein ONZ45_g12340 [Pleurotus djamor]|nr:hypothetical protein ONZ45_g12340 [Pleurotus djamor]
MAFLNHGKAKMKTFNDVGGNQYNTTNIYHNHHPSTNIPAHRSNEKRDDVATVKKHPARSKDYMGAMLIRIIGLSMLDTTWYNVLAVWSIVVFAGNIDECGVGIEKLLALDSDVLFDAINQILGDSAHSDCLKKDTRTRSGDNAKVYLENLLAMNSRIFEATNRPFEIGALRGFIKKKDMRTTPRSQLTTQ